MDSPFEGGQGDVFMEIQQHVILEEIIEIYDDRTHLEKILYDKKS
jgi:hypothetical protein